MRFIKKLRNMSAVLCLVMVAASFAIPEALAGSHPLQGKCIVLDAGHGGFDGGAVGVTGTREDELNLSVTKQVAGLLSDCGAEVILTRENGDALGINKSSDMRARGKIIASAQADIMVSIHMNRFTHPSSWGAQVFYQRGSEQGAYLAEILQDALVTCLQPDNYRRKQSSDYYVLKAGPAPAALVECGFLSNPSEEKQLTDPDYQSRLAWCIYYGIVRYFALTG